MTRACNAATISLWVACGAIAQSGFPIRDITGLDDQLGSAAPAHPAAPAVSPGTGVSAALQIVPNLGFSEGVTPEGKLDGVNLKFVLPAEPPPSASLLLYLNGLLQREPEAFTLSGATILFRSSAAPEPGDVLVAFYQHRPNQAVNRAPTDSTPLLDSARGPILQQVLRVAATTESNEQSDDLRSIKPASAAAPADLNGETISSITQRLERQSPSGPVDQLRGMVAERGWIPGQREIGKGEIGHVDSPGRAKGRSGSEVLEELSQRADPGLNMGAATLRKLQELLNSRP